MTEITDEMVERAARAIARSIPIDGTRWNFGHGENFPNEYTAAEQRLIRGIARSALTAALAGRGELSGISGEMVAALHWAQAELNEIGIEPGDHEGVRHMDALHALTAALANHIGDADEKVADLGASSGPQNTHKDRLRAEIDAVLTDFEAQVVRDTARRCAEMAAPRGARPCDCDRCYCGKSEDAERVAAWDEQDGLAHAIRSEFGLDGAESGAHHDRRPPHPPRPDRTR